MPLLQPVLPALDPGCPVVATVSYLAVALDIRNHGYEHHEEHEERPDIGPQHKRGDRRCDKHCCPNRRATDLMVPLPVECDDELGHASRWLQYPTMGDSALAWEARIHPGK